MWHRPAAAILLLTALVLAPRAGAQTNNVYSRAIPPDKAVLERLNLKVEWTANIPVEGRRDSLTQIQTIDDQIFVQTRTGLLIAGDALTGQLQWFVQLGNGDFANTYPVAANSQYVYVAHVTKLHAFHRYTGVVEFVSDLGTPPTTGLAADETGVYCVLGMRTGNSGAHRISVYDPPRPIAIAAAPKGPTDPTKPPVKDPKAQNPVDNLMSRYAPTHMYRTNLPDVFEPTRNIKSLEAPVGGMTGGRSPSLSALPRITPPYTLQNEASTPSLSALPSLRHPYRLRNDFQRDIQQTPSLGVIPPSVAASLRLADLRPKNIEPPLRWEYGFTSRIIYPLFLTPTRVWAVTDSKAIMALNKRDKKIEAIEQMADPISAYPGRAGLMAYIPLGSGYLVAVEGSSGNLAGGANIHWRTAIGGIANRTPFVTEKFVYAQGDNSGVVALDRATGEIIWRSDSTADRIIGANQELLYVRDRQGRLLAFDAKRPTDAAKKHSAPLAALDLAEFNVHIVNTASDRIYLAADNGLIVCLRDMNAKYARPVKISPDATINLIPKVGVDTTGKDGEPKKDPGEPKKEPDPKKELDPKKN
jgi:outer membrane protein assembly factor BamB